jgi:ankyrin repeat protein
MMGRVKIVHALLAAGAFVNAKTLDDATPLHWAASSLPHLRPHKTVAPVNDSHECIKLLLAAGANINLRTAAGKSPEDLAIQNNRFATADILNSFFEHGALDLAVSLAAPDQRLRRI